MTADNEQRIGIAQEGQPRRLFNVTIFLQGRETPVDVYSTGTGDKEVTILRAPGFKAQAIGGVDEIARVMNPVSGARIRRAHQIFLAESEHNKQ
jgi:hypothetical protein